MCRPCNHRSGFLSPATDEEIADDLFLSVGEVKAHINVLSAKLGVGKPPGAEARIELLERAFSAGLISGSDV
jgi:DNA-binding NarL/FixJ family response regulator